MLHFLMYTVVCLLAGPGMLWLVPELDGILPGIMAVIGMQEKCFTFFNLFKFGFHLLSFDFSIHFWYPIN